MPHLAQLARRFFAPAEAAAVVAAPPEKQTELFFRFWTLKEAYIKALGTGMYTPLASFSFTLNTTRPPTISFSSNSQEQEKPTAWQFFQFDLEGDYQLALAHRRPAIEPCEIRMHVIE
jgi:4'-phosphopantetheinyl transferase